MRASRKASAPKTKRIVSATLGLALLGSTLAIAAILGAAPQAASALWDGHRGGGGTVPSVENSATPRVAIVRSAIAQGAPTGNHYIRVDRVAPWLRTEFGSGNVTVIGDTELSSSSALSRYDVVVLIRQIAMTRSQRIAVRTYAGSGGGVVAVFGAGRWDYSPYRSKPYIRNMEIYGNGVHEWGEVSPVWGVSFYNDPITDARHHIIGEYASNQQILQLTHTQLARSARLDMAPARDEANEYVINPRGSSITPLARYSNAPCTGVPGNGAGWIAGWTNQYGRGRAVYYGCQITDVAGALGSADADSNRQARALFLNSVRWAGTGVTIRTSTTRAYIGSTVDLSGSLNPSGGLVGKTMHVDVKKPGKLRWSYSSERGIYAGTGTSALWQYKYRLVSGVPRGTHYFRAVLPGAPGGITRISNTVALTVK